MDGFEQWKHLLMQIAHGSEPTEQVAAWVRAQIEQFHEQAEAADETAVNKWLHNEIGSISHQVVPSSDLEKPPGARTAGRFGRVTTIEARRTWFVRITHADAESTVRQTDVY